MNRILIVLVSQLLCLGLLADGLFAENWPRFRGIDGQGISQEAGFPTKWDESDYAWVADIEGYSHSSPVVWDDRLFVTTGLNSGKTRRLLCLNPATGKEIWQRDLSLNSVHLHQKNSFASGSPMTDGKHVVTAFADEGQFIVACWTVEGKELWRYDMGAFESQHGPSCSPIIHKNLVIVPKDMLGPSNVTALALDTGEVAWKTDREYNRTSYATPFVRTRNDGIEEVICVSGMMGIAGLNVENGETIWRTDRFPERTVSSPVLCDDLVIAISGGGGRGKNLYAVELDQTGRVTPEYTLKRQIPYVPTSVCREGLLFMILDGGLASCLEAETGEEVWTERLGGNFSGSPIWADGKLYVIDESGTVVVLSASREFQELGRVPLGDLSYATPVVANGRMFFKTATKLFCLPKK